MRGRVFGLALPVVLKGSSRFASTLVVGVFEKLISELQDKPDTTLSKKA